MRTKDTELIKTIKTYIEDKCEKTGRVPPYSEIAEDLGVGKTTVKRYLDYMAEKGMIARGHYGYESIEQ